MQYRWKSETYNPQKLKIIMELLNRNSEVTLHAQCRPTATGRMPPSPPRGVSITRTSLPARLRHWRPPEAALTWTHSNGFANAPYFPKFIYYVTNKIKLNIEKNISNDILLFIRILTSFRIVTVSWEIQLQTTMSPVYRLWDDRDSVA